MSNNITPKEKAVELVDKHYSISGITRFSKAYALITVDEIIDAIDKSLINSDIEFFKQVKQEIEKL